VDIHSHAQPDAVRVTHASLDLELDFAARIVRGSVRLDLERRDAHAPLRVDAQALTITAVRGVDGTPLAHTLTGEDPVLGGTLEISLRPEDQSVAIDYATTADCQAVQWLQPEQTHGRRQPFLFTQGQSILTRTWIPLQDSPGVRMTYDARIRVPQGLVPVMSAESLGRDEQGAYRFRMPQAIPSYLIALACGDLAFEPISERCGIWADPALVKSARAELEDTERMIVEAEQLFGPYRWGRYDLIVLPPAFPFGGMENPRLTFATPTILAGDKSLVSLVAHELAHSWSGNLVTNATWRDFWLNEGFTVYFEGRIMEVVYGTERARMERQLAIAELEKTLRELEPWQTVLHIDLEGHHPDDGFSDVPYTKGALFLTRIEQLAGRERFDGFLRRWFDEHAFRSVTTEQFLRFLDRELIAEDRARYAPLNIDEWLTQPGLPADAPRPSTDALTRVDRELTKWRLSRQVEGIDTTGWVTQQWQHFLEGLESDLDASAMAKLDARFALTQTGNSEVLVIWLRLAIRHGYKPADARLQDFLMTVGRRKFLEPLYKQLAATQQGLERAKSIYAGARPRYHAVTAGTIDEILGTKH
jgi:aminopeptidase N